METVNTWLREIIRNNPDLKLVLKAGTIHQEHIDYQ